MKPEELEKIFPVAFSNERVVIYQLNGQVNGEGVPGDGQFR